MVLLCWLREELGAQHGSVLGLAAGGAPMCDRLASARWSGWWLVRPKTDMDACPNMLLWALSTAEVASFEI
jgi:hypothetical protein